jgi:hypothetical protein
MLKNNRVALWLAGLVVGTTLGTGCIASAQFRTPGVVFYDATPEPPPPQYESYSVRPGFIWMTGRYDWRGGQWVWLGGHYERERVGYTYAPGRWQRRGNGHVWVEGEWRGGGGGREQVRDHRQERHEERREERHEERRETRDHRH